MTTREPHEGSRREGRDSHGRRPHSSSRSRRDDPSPRRRRDGRRHESFRAHYRSRDEESAKVSDRDQKRNRDAEQRNDPPNAEPKSVSDAKNDQSARHEKSPRGTKRFSESREAWRPRSFFQLKDWKDTVFGSKDIPEIQAGEIAYIDDYKIPVQTRKPKAEGEENKRKAEENKGPVRKKARLNEGNERKNDDDDQFFRSDIDRATLDFYKQRVLGRTRDKIILHILDHQLSEMNYVECFKLRGYMDTSILFLQCALWNKEWKENGTSKVILSHQAMCELLNPVTSTKYLAAELLTDTQELQANLVFVPIVHEKHWFLIVITRNKKKICILDSFPQKGMEPVISNILRILKQQLAKSSAGSDYTCVRNKRTAMIAVSSLSNISKDLMIHRKSRYLNLIRIWWKNSA